MGGSSEDIVRVQESASSREAGKGKQLNKFGLIFSLNEFVGNRDQ